MTYKKRKPKYNWRAFLTVEERAEIEAADKARAEWEKRWRKMSANRARIMNRAVQRAKYATTGTEHGS